MTVFFVLMILACLNIGLGYGLAVYLGHAASMEQGELPIARGTEFPAQPKVAIGALQAAFPNGTPEDLTIEPETEPELPPEAPTEIPAPAPVNTRREVSEEDKQAAAAEVAVALGMSLESLGQPATPAAADVEQVASDDQPVEQPTEPTTDEPRQRSEFESSVSDFHNTLTEYSDKLNHLDQQMRTHADHKDTKKIKATIEDIRQVNDAYLRDHDHAVEKLSHDGAEEVASDQLRESLQEQGRQVQSANQELNAIDLAGNLNAELARAFGQTAKINHANCTARDSVDETLYDLARNEDRLDTLENDLRIDPLTGLLSKAGLQADVQQAIESRESKQTPLSIALVDIDNFQTFNKGYGSFAGDQALKAIAEVFDHEEDSPVVVGRYRGGTFMVAWPDLPARNSTVEVEQIRQGIECTKFVIGSETTNLTVSCSVVQHIDNESRDDLFRRAEATMKEARRYGRNRSFLNEGNQPAPILPPNLTVEERLVPIERPVS